MSLEELLRRAVVRRATELSSGRTRRSGFPALDRLLPGQGWPRAGLTELCVQAGAPGGLRLLLPALAAVTGEDQWSIWIDPPYVPYAPALAMAGVGLERMLVLGRAGRAATCPERSWWACEQALRCTDCGVVLFWCETASFRQLRRLQLAAGTGMTWGVLFRPATAATQASPAALRLVLSGVAEGGVAEGATLPAGVEVAVLKAMGGRAGTRCWVDFTSASVSAGA